MVTAVASSAVPETPRIFVRMPRLHLWIYFFLAAFLLLMLPWARRDLRSRRMISRLSFATLCATFAISLRGMRRAWSQRSYSAADDGYRHAGRDLHHHSDGNGEYDYGDDVGDAYRGLKINSENVSRYLNGSAPRSTLPPERIIPTLRPSAPMRAIQRGRGSDCAGWLDHNFHSLPQQAHRGDDFIFTDERNFIDQTLRMAKVRGESDARSPSAIVSG